jgi:hypothetical protein
MHPQKLLMSETRRVEWNQPSLNKRVWLAPKSVCSLDGHEGALESNVDYLCNRRRKAGEPT